MTPTRSAIVSASSWSCVTKIALCRAVRRISRTSPRNCVRSARSRLENGSSSRPTSGRGPGARARALANRPKVLRPDEPLSALDFKLRKEMQIELKKLQLETGITFVFVTHDQEEALSLSDRVAVFNRGRIEQVGTPQEVYERPASAFVAGLVGS